MAICSYLLLSGIFVLMTFLQTGTSDTLITQQHDHVNEYSPVQFRCSTSVSWTPEGIRWILYNRNDTEHTRIAVQTSKCSTFSDIVSFEFNFTCVNRTLYTLTILNTTHEFQYLKINCELYTDISTNTSSNITIKVSVPVKSVRMEPASNEIVSAENKAILVYCNTSFSYPTPTVCWVLQRGTTRAIIEDSSVKTTSTSVDNFISTKSELSLLPNRTLNNWYLVCEASNVKGGNSVTKQVQLNITYPPDNPPIIYGYSNNDTYKVILSRQGHLSCIIQDRNPLPSLTWDCFNHQVLSNYRGNDKVVTNITWTATHGQTLCTCRFQYMSTVKQTKINIDILFPPSVPTLKWNSTIISGVVKVIENNTLTVVCESSSNPPAEYEWVGTSISPVARNTLEILNIQRSKFGKYTCTTRNQMHPSNGQMEYGSSSSSVIVDVLYPAELSYELKDISVVEGQIFSIACPVIAGNPPMTIFRWTSEVSETTINEPDILITNVSRYDSGIYTCTIYNEMKPSDGSVIMYHKTASFHLNVFYLAKVTRLTVNDNHISSTIVINKRAPLLVECTAEGNPLADITLSLITNGKPANLANDISLLLYNVSSSSHLDAGIYECTGANNFTQGEPSRSAIAVIVKGHPRPYVDETNPIVKFTKLQETVTLIFMAHPYVDVKCTTTFTWYNSTAPIHVDGERIKIIEKGFRSELIIENIRNTDFGNYTLNVTNSVGGYVHLYEIIVKAEYDESKSKINFSAVIAGGLVGVLVLVIAVLVTLWVSRKRIRGKPVKEVYHNVHLHGNGNVYDRVTPVQDRTDIEMKELTYESTIAGSHNTEERCGGQENTTAPSSGVNPIYTNLQP